MSGVGIVRHVCRACQHALWQGAVGADISIAAATNLEAAVSPLTSVVNGPRGMRLSGSMMSAIRLRAVVIYLRRIVEQQPNQIRSRLKKKC